VAGGTSGLERKQGIIRYIGDSRDFKEKVGVSGGGTEGGGRRLGGRATKKVEEGAQNKWEGRGFGGDRRNNLGQRVGRDWGPEKDER